MNFYFQIIKEIQLLIPMEKKKYIFNTQHIRSYNKLRSTRANQLNAKDNEVLDNMVNYSRKTGNYLNFGPFEI